MAVLARDWAQARPVTGDDPFEHLFMAEYARVVGIARRVLGDADEAEDVAQDVFYAYFRQHPADASFAPAWLYRAAIHTALNRIRTRTRREAREIKEAGQAAPTEAPNPEVLAMRSEDVRAVRRALACLPERSAAILILRYSGLSYAEIADNLHLSINAIGTTLRRAETAVRKEMLRATPR